MTEIELLPCPFCGGKPKWDEWYVNGCDAFCLQCSECFAKSGTGFVNEKHLIIDGWNKRCISGDQVVAILNKVAEDMREPIQE